MKQTEQTVVECSDCSKWLHLCGNENFQPLGNVVQVKLLKRNWLELEGAAPKIHFEASSTCDLTKDPGTDIYPGQHWTTKSRTSTFKKNQPFTLLSAAAKPIPRNTTKWDSFINTGNRSKQAGRTNICWMLRMLTTPSLRKWVLPLLWGNAMAARKGFGSEAAEEKLPCGSMEKTQLRHSPKGKVVRTRRGRTEDTLPSILPHAIFREVPCRNSIHLQSRRSQLLEQNVHWKVDINLCDCRSKHALSRRVSTFLSTFRIVKCGMQIESFGGQKHTEWIYK